MFRDMKRYGRDPNVVVRSKTTFNAPLKWAKSGELPAGSRIFTCSWSDWFIDKADEWRDEAWKVIKATPQFTYMILTKRPERIIGHLPDDWGDGYRNVWMLVSTENQRMFNERYSMLDMFKCRIKGISAEPLLGAIDLGLYQPDWVITGGESDPTDPRPASMEWFTSLRDQTKAYGGAYFHKQHGGSKKVDGAWGGRALDDGYWNEFPE
jgi:protein gp37